MPGDDLTQIEYVRWRDRELYDMACFRRVRGRILSMGIEGCGWLESWLYPEIMYLRRRLGCRVFPELN